MWETGYRRDSHYHGALSSPTYYTLRLSTIIATSMAIDSKSNDKSLKEASSHFNFVHIHQLEWLLVGYACMLLAGRRRIDRKCNRQDNNYRQLTSYNTRKVEWLLTTCLYDSAEKRCEKHGYGDYLPTPPFHPTYDYSYTSRLINRYVVSTVIYFGPS
jgi:hypothetical protein